MKKSTFAALLAAPSLLFSTVSAQAGHLDGDALKSATQAIEHTIGAGNIRASKLNGDPLGAIEEAGTSILSTRRQGGAKITAQSFIADTENEVAFTVGITNKKGQTSVAQIKLSAEDNYDQGTITNLSGGPDMIEATLLLRGLTDSFKFNHDDANTELTEAALKTAAKKTLDRDTVDYTEYDESLPTTIHIRACYPTPSGTACNEIASTTYANYDNQTIGLKIAASMIDPAENDGEDRKKTVVTTYMSDIRDLRTVDGPYSTPFQNDADAVKKAALAIEGSTVLADFLMNHHYVVPGSNRISAELGGIQFSSYAPVVLASTHLLIKTNDPHTGINPFYRPHVELPSPLGLQ